MEAINGRKTESLTRVTGVTAEQVNTQVNQTFNQTVSATKILGTKEKIEDFDCVSVSFFYRLIS